MLVLQMLILMFEIPEWCRILGWCAVGVMLVQSHTRNPGFVDTLVGIAVGGGMMIPSTASSKMFLAQVVPTISLDPIQQFWALYPSVLVCDTMLAGVTLTE